MTPLVAVLQRTADYFKQKGIPSPRLDAELLIGHVLGFDRVKVYLNFDRPFSDAELDALRPLVRRRGKREPLAWILGEKEFWEHTFTCTSGVLVPRPETEHLVEAALALLPTEAEGEPVFVADIGSGTGCIGLSLVLARPRVRLYAVDLADAALACTRANVERHGVKERVAVRKGDGMSAIPADRPVHWVVANPPYIPTATLDTLEPEVREHEPRLALDGGPDGLEPYRRLIPTAARRATGGVLVEVGAGQAADIGAMMRAAGLTDVRIHPDLAGIERVVIGLHT